MSVLLLFVCFWHVHHLHTCPVPSEARRGCQITLELGYRSWVLGTEPLAFAKGASVLTAEPFLQPQEILVIFTYLLLFFKWFLCVVMAVVELTL